MPFLIDSFVKRLTHELPVASPHLDSPAAAPLAGPRRRTNGEDVAAAETHNKRFLQMLPQRPWVRRLRVVLERDACLACRYQPAEIALDDLPALPHRRCTRNWGCACWYDVP